MIDGVIFDMDGVIVESEHLWEESWAECCARRDVAWSLDDTRRCQGMSSPEWSAYLAARIGDPALAPAARSECVDHVVKAVESGRAPLLPGAVELVSEAGHRLASGLASSAALPVIHAVLDHWELDHFDEIVSSEEVVRGKPSPDVYLEAARRIGLDPAKGIAVEDSGNGIRAASAAGLHVIAIPNRDYPPPADALALADHVVTDAAEALAYLLSLLR
ncbi:HAD family hydrolase [Phytomonospora endophytica]|uniref:HAD superfamily hydrolase (TIGR01509 family) n=1 Tax=Phytomonospora endophytica TaxID=714109 RepID=A0A841G0D7_9ACTN|nr:HAD family phosphatase [Phytomonospora endophytica]MBB6038149.1 HAD superfamily hydrolase (TIGR01509 family) [Phytomonospora endophytica]GIG67388.1 haloacid dehalogenase [Phytomonospora endophytica]